MKTHKHTPGPWERERAAWLDAQFEFENCAECRKGAENHTVCTGPFGHWFARCNGGENRAIKTNRVPLLYQGKNPHSIQAEAEIERGGDDYTEIRIGCFREGVLVADVFVGLNEAGEIRVLLTLDADGDEHQLAVYPERSRETAVEDFQ